MDDAKIALEFSCPRCGKVLKVTEEEKIKETLVKCECGFKVIVGEDADARIAKGL